jgi:SAM-dependent methyltransferase
LSSQVVLRSALEHLSRLHSRVEAAIDTTDERSADPDSRWSNASTVAGFVRSSPNDTLLHVAAREWRASARLLDIGCGAGRNALPLASAGWEVVGTDLSFPMLTATAARVADAQLANRLRLLLAPMDRLPLPSACVDFIVAHGIWNLARSGREFREAIREAKRVARPGCALFVFTFSRNTLADTAEPLDGESFVFTQFSGQPQCFLTEKQLVTELAAFGFESDPSLPLRELNRPPKGALRTSTTPVIYEGLFRCRRR